MNQFTHALIRWLQENDIPTKDVRIIVEFPNEDALYRAQTVIKREIDSTAQFPTTRGALGDIDTWNGLGLTLKVK